MFFKKKNEELTDQHAVFQERGSPRWGSPQNVLSAGITISGFEGEGQVGNVSITGCSLHSVTYVNIIPDEIYDVRIIPEKVDNLAPFSLKLKLSWTKSSETLFLAGFSLDGGSSSAELKRYVEILRGRGIPPDFGNMGSGNK